MELGTSCCRELLTAARSNQQFYANIFLVFLPLHICENFEYFDPFGSEWINSNIYACQSVDFAILFQPKLILLP
jgi:hypothetical protein